METDFISVLLHSICWRKSFQPMKMTPTALCWLNCQSRQRHGGSTVTDMPTKTATYWINQDSDITYFDTWSGFEAAKTVPWPSRGLTHFDKFLEPSDEWAGRGWCCFLWWHSWAFFSDQEWTLETCRAKIWIFPVLKLSMSSRYFGNESYNRSPNTVIALSWRDCAGFLLLDTE